MTSLLKIRLRYAGSCVRGKGNLEVDIRGRLQELLGAPFLRRSVGGGLVVAGEGLEPPTPGL